MPDFEWGIEVEVLFWSVILLILNDGGELLIILFHMIIAGNIELTDPVAHQISDHIKLILTLLATQPHSPFLLVLIVLFRDIHNIITQLDIDHGTV